jgi:hypothetical protein
MSILWDRWMTERNPIAFLQRVDRDIRTNRWQSRLEAFEDYISSALRRLYPPHAIQPETVLWMAEHLLEEAETEEELMLLSLQYSRPWPTVANIRSGLLQSAN